MSYNLAALGTYTDELSFDLISKAVLQTNLMQYSTIRSGLRNGTTTINLLDADIAVADRACGWDVAGDLVYTQVDITMAEKQTKSSLCPTDLRDFYLGQRLSPSANATEVPFEEVVANLFVEKIKNFNEGFLATELFAAVTVANGATDSGQTVASTLSTIVDDVMDLIDAVDPAVLDRDDLAVFMSPANFNLLRRALTAQNLFHYVPSDNNTSLMIPGTNFLAIKGTFNNAKMIAGAMQTVIIGVGLEDDFDNLRIFYSQDNDEVRVGAAWRLGLAVTDVTKFAKNGVL